MLRKIGVAISYFIAIIYILIVVMPLAYCLQHGCRGPGEGDAFMPAVLFIPLGGIASAFSLHNAIQHIKGRQPWSWAFWLPAIAFGMVLLGILAFIMLMIYELASHR